LLDDFNEFIDSYTLRSATGLITTTRPLPRTIQAYKVVRKSLEEFGSQHKVHLTYNAISLEFYSKYSAWLTRFKNVTDATLSNYIKILKTFMKWARDRDYHDTSQFEKFYRQKSPTDTIALSVDEIRIIRDLDLSNNPRLSRVRDHFLLQCFTGMRYGDLAQLEPRHFDDDAGVIRFTTTKTNTKCIIPITRPIRTLLARYPSRIFEFASDVKQNLYLKELAARAGLSKEVSIAQYRGGRRVETVKPKHELITTHVARRSFASTSVRFGVPESVIAIVTGHSAKGMLQQHYIKLDEEAVRDIVVNAWDHL
jgi:integrase